jgi:hypothetical protein
VKYFCKYLSIDFLQALTPLTETRIPAKTASLTSTGLRSDPTFAGRESVMAARGERFDLRPNEAGHYSSFTVFGCHVARWPSCLTRCWRLPSIDVFPPE